MSTAWPSVINLVNTAFGVTVLAVPYCFHQCGIILGILLLMIASYLTKRSCTLLLRSAQISRKRDFESLGFHVNGFLGKFVIEMSLIGYLVGTAIAWFVVIGDVAPAVISSLLGVEKSWGLRMLLVVSIGLGVVLPLSLVKDITSLSSASKLAIAIYSLFVLQLFFSTLPKILSGNWVDAVNFWNPAGVLQCLPIFGISFLCQTVLFVLYEALPEPSVKKMEHIVSTSMDIVLFLSGTVGFCGYVMYYDDGIQGDLLNNYKHDFVSEFIRLGFCISTILSFPLLVFPCRASINSMISSAKMISVEGSEVGGAYIPHERFVIITCSLIVGTLIFGILFPNVEFVMALVGATMGAMLTFILPSYIFLNVAGEDTSKTEAKLVAATQYFAASGLYSPVAFLCQIVAKFVCLLLVLLVLGICLFCLSTFSVLSMGESHEKIVELSPLQPKEDILVVPTIFSNGSIMKNEEDEKIALEVNRSNKNISLENPNDNSDQKQEIGDRESDTAKDVSKENTATTVKVTRKEPVLPQERVLMSATNLKTEHHEVNEDKLDVNETDVLNAMEEDMERLEKRKLEPGPKKENESDVNLRPSSSNMSVSLSSLSSKERKAISGVADDDGKKSNEDEKNSNADGKNSDDDGKKSDDDVDKGTTAATGTSKLKDRRKLLNSSRTLRNYLLARAKLHGREPATSVRLHREI